MLIVYCINNVIFIVIFKDANQILFRACGKITGDVECTTPIAAIFEDSTCQLHMDIPHLKSYNQVRKDSESDMDDSGGATNTTNYSTDNFTENIKHEFVPYDIPPELPKMETLPSLLFEENSHSLSESTISQNEIFNISDTNEMTFYQISKSCTIVPNTAEDSMPVNTTNNENQTEIRNEIKSEILQEPKVIENVDEVIDYPKEPELKASPTMDSYFADQILDVVQGKWLKYTYFFYRFIDYLSMLR